MSLTTVKDFSQVLGPDAKELGTLTPPREFNLMFKTIVGALGGEEGCRLPPPRDGPGHLRQLQERARQHAACSVPFGIAQIGKSFRNEITPRNFTFRSREFEQMEIEFFCHPEPVARVVSVLARPALPAGISTWAWPASGCGCASTTQDELSHYSVRHGRHRICLPVPAAGRVRRAGRRRPSRRLRPAQPHGRQARAGKGERAGRRAGRRRQAEAPRQRQGPELLRRPDHASGYVPHVIEPSAGADRATLAFLCEAYHEDKAPDENGKLQKRVVLKLHPRLAPIKAAVFPLVKKDGMPEVAQEIYRDLKPHFNVFYDEKGAVGRRYRRQDEAGTPFCITVDGQTLQDRP